MFNFFTAAFMFIEAFNSDLTSWLVSLPITGTGEYCVTFYFASFFTDGTAVLTFSRSEPKKT